MPTTEFSFEQWVLLYQTDPEQFQLKKLEYIQNFIDECPTNSSARLKATQNHIEWLLSKSSNPHHANVLLAKEIRQSLGQLKSLLEEPSQYMAQKAQVIPLTQDRKPIDDA